MKKSMRGIVLYSSQVWQHRAVAMTERKKPNALAATLREVTSGVRDQRLADIRMTREELNDLIRNVEIQDTMLAALGRPSPWSTG